MRCGNLYDKGVTNMNQNRVDRIRQFCDGVMTFSGRFCNGVMRFLDQIRDGVMRFLDDRKINPPDPVS